MEGGVGSRKSLITLFVPLVSSSSWFARHVQVINDRKFVDIIGEYISLVPHHIVVPLLELLPTPCGTVAVLADKVPCPLFTNLAHVVHSIVPAIIKLATIALELLLSALLLFCSISDIFSSIFRKTFYRSYGSIRFAGSPHFTDSPHRSTRAATPPHAPNLPDVEELRREMKRQDEVARSCVSSLRSSSSALSKPRSCIKPGRLPSRSSPRR